jgi:hypothetical protein
MAPRPGCQKNYRRFCSQTLFVSVAADYFIKNADKHYRFTMYHGADIDDDRFLSILDNLDTQK